MTSRLTGTRHSARARVELTLSGARGSIPARVCCDVMCATAEHSSHRLRSLCLPRAFIINMSIYFPLSFSYRLRGLEDGLELLRERERERELELERESGRES